MTAAGPLMLDLQSLTLSDTERSLLCRGPVGGVILFSRNYRDIEQLQALTAEIHALRPELLIAVDHEGGRVQRFRDGFTPIPAMGVLAELCRDNPGNALVLAQECGWLLASELLAVGIDISFTPVLDLNRGISSVIGDRALGSKAEGVIALAGALMSGMHEAGMATTGKHFPGHGGVAEDSHHEIPVDMRSYEQIEAEDLRPFAKFAKQGMDAVMPAHVIYTHCAPEPAGFSRFWLETVLRGRLGFNGIIFSDDLSMDGAKVAGDYHERAAAALKAGCDMVLVCNQPEAALQVLEWMEHQNLMRSARIPAMKAKRNPDLQALRQSPRWQECREQLNQLEAH